MCDDDGVRWASYKNVHRELGDSVKLNWKLDANEDAATTPRAVDPFFKQRVCVTVKMDGSNLGVHIVKDDGAEGGWVVEALLGRKSVIWSRSDGDDVSKLNNIGKYGNAGSLQALPLKMRDFAVTLGNKLGVKELAVYGEAYMSPKSKFASWHPFGYKLPEEGWRVARMTSAVHALLCETSGHGPLATYQDSEALLAQQTGHVVYPPPLLFVGELGPAIEALTETMTTSADVNFEGCFCVLEDGLGGFKWKTGTHDEQPAIPQLSELHFAEACARVAYEALLRVYGHRQKRPGCKNGGAANGKGNNQLDSLLEADVAEAFARELSKRLSFADVPKRDRLPIAADMTEGVVQEAISRYRDASAPCLYTEKQLRSKAPGLVKSLVMRT